MSYGNQYMHDRNLPRFGYTDPAPLSDEVLVSPEQEDGEYSLSETYLARQEEYREKLGTPEYDYENWPDPRLFVCSLEPFIDSVQMTIDGVKAYRKVAQVEFGKWWEMDPSTGNDPQTFYGWGLSGNTTFWTDTCWMKQRTWPDTISISSVCLTFVRKMGGIVRGDEMVGGCTPPAAWCGRSRLL